MKHTVTSFRLLGAIVLLALAAACATQEKENLLIAAGFRAITPKNPDQEQILKSLPAGKVTLVKYQGQTYYVMPDAANHQAYVGGPDQYQAYQQLRLQKQLSNENLQAAQMYQDSSMNWGAWGGWGGPVVMRR